jgi:hypothetical protein
MKCCNYIIVKRTMTIMLIGIFFLSSLGNAAGVNKLAPPLATKPPCEIVENENGILDVGTGKRYDVIFNQDVIHYWENETRENIRAGNTLGKSFRNRWAFMEISLLIRQALQSQISKYTLISLMEKHIERRDGVAEIILEGYDIHAIEEIRDNNGIKGFFLPIRRKGEYTYHMIFTLENGELKVLADNFQKVSFDKLLEDYSEADGGVSVISKEPIMGEKPSFPRRGMDVGKFYGTRVVSDDEELMSEKEMFVLIRELSEEMKKEGISSAKKIEQALARIKNIIDFKKYGYHDFSEYGMATRILAAFIDNLRKSEEGSYIIHFARDCGITYTIQKTLCELDGVPVENEAGVLYLNRKMMGDIYFSIMKMIKPYKVVFNEQGAYLPSRESGLTKEDFIKELDNWFAHEMSMGEDTPFAEFARKVYGNLKEMGVLQKENIVLLDSGTHGTAQWYIKALIRHFDRSSARKIEIKLITSATDLVSGLSNNDFAENDLELFAQHGISLCLENEDFRTKDLSDEESKRIKRDGRHLWFWKNVHLRDTIEMIGNFRMHPVRFGVNSEGGYSVVFEESADRRLMYNFISLICRNMAVAQKLGVIGPGSLGSELISRREAADRKNSMANKRGEEKVTVETEQVHSTFFADIVKMIEAENKSEKTMVFLGTSWIKGYETGRHLQHDAINPLINRVKRFCNSHNVSFRNMKDDELLGIIEEEKKSNPNIKIIVLAGEDTVAAENFASLRNDKRIFLTGVNNNKLTEDSYMRLVEMITITLKLASNIPVDLLNNQNISINRKDGYIQFIPNAEPMDYEKIKEIYNMQIFA